MIPFRMAMDKSQMRRRATDSQEPMRVVYAYWDEAAKVWWARSDDVPGLVSEAPTFEQLLDNIVALVPDLLELNGQEDGEISVTVRADRTLRLPHHAAWMADTFDRELLAFLERAGCYFVRQGRHPIYYSPITNRNFPVPTGIKSRHTANEVLKQAGLPKAF